MWYAFFLCLLEKGAPGAGRTRLMLTMLVSGGCWLLTLFDLWGLVAYALRFVGNFGGGGGPLPPDPGRRGRANDAAGGAYSAAQECLLCVSAQART